MEIYPWRNINLPFLKVKNIKPTSHRFSFVFDFDFDFFLSQINYVNNSSSSRDISNNFRSNLSNKMQINDIPEGRKTLILRAPPQIFIEAKRTRSYLAIRTHFGVITAKPNLRAKHLRVPPA